jgi:NAD(P)-dependent dehydrogenase (short-subunit alcohol dehydrogenase family)
MNAPLLNSKELTEFFLARIPVGHWGDAKDIGQLALFLCHENAGFITGTDILIDGGWAAQ